MGWTGTGIDPGSQELKVVRGRPKGDRFQVLAATAAPAGRPPDGGAPGGDGAERLREFLARVRPGRGRAVLGMTGRDLMLRYTQLPRLPAHRLEVLMDFEVREIAEKIEGEVAADYSLLPGEIGAGGGGEQMALVAMVKEGPLEARFEAAAAGGGAVRYACPDAVAAFNAFLKFGSFREGETTLLLDVGAENCDLAIQRDGDLLFARNLSFGGSTFTEAIRSRFGVGYRRAEELKIARGRLPVRGETRFEDGLAEKTARALSGTLGQLVGMVQSSVSFCKVQWKRRDLKVDRIVLSGGGARLAGFAEALGEAAGIPAERFDPTARLDLSLLSAEEAKRFADAPERFVVPLGLALMAADPRFFRLEVLPARLRRRRKVRERTVWVGGAGAAALAYLVLSGVAGHQGLRAAETRNAAVSTQERERRRNEDRYEKLASEATEKAARLETLHRATLPGFALARTIEGVQERLDGVEGLWVQGIEVKRVPGAGKGKADHPMVVVEGAGVETDEDVGSVCDRFAAALKRDLGERWGARASHSFRRRTRTFTIEVDFEPPGAQPPGAEPQAEEDRTGREGR